MAVAGLTFIPQTGSRSVAVGAVIVAVIQASLRDAGLYGLRPPPVELAGYYLVVITFKLDLCCWITDALYWIHPAGRAGNSNSSY